ncbi:MAG: class I SAM-dependent methyltransferase [Pseudomonadota bacterium]
MTETSKRYVEIFDDSEHADQYADSPTKFMPGYHAVQKMAGVLLRQYTPSNARVLVHGAGGGSEIEAFAKENSEWTFLGVEPAKPMLEEARKRLGEFSQRVKFHHGYVEDAPSGPFDASTSLLTLHFLNTEERRKAVSEIVRRLKPGAAFIAAHCSFSQNTDQREVWLQRHKAFTMASGVDAETAENGRKVISDSLEVLDPEIDEKILRDAGLSDVTLFYAAFTWRGWVGRVP